MRPWNRWFAFLAWAVVILAVAPAANDIQEWISGRFGERALRLMLTALLLAAAAGFVVWLARNRRGFDLRRILWVLALSGTTLAVMWRLEVAAEPAHLAEYAILGGLAFHALAARLRDGGVYLAAAALAAIVGTLDEVFQWLLPHRYWGPGDIVLDAAAGILVQLLIWKGIRPPDISPGVGARSLRVAVRLAACWVLLLALCLANTPRRIDWYAARVPGLGYLGKGLDTRMSEYGHRYLDPDIGRFQSRLAPEELRRADRQRGAAAARVLDRYRQPERYHKFQLTYPPNWTPFLFEAGGHLFYRERLRQRLQDEPDPAEKRRLATVAYRENLILERYFPHTLASSNVELAPEERQQLEELNLPDVEFASEVSNWLLTGFSEAQARWALLTILAGLVFADRSCSRLSAGGRG